MKLTKAKTFVYIDVSNIRSACQLSCGFQIDFAKLYRYLVAKYPHLQDVRFYEGISPRDRKRLAEHRALAKLGYTICPLSRKAYYSKAEYQTLACKKCGAQHRIKTTPAKRSLKSNVDVYLASDMVERAAHSRLRPIHIILVSCDGDYAEAIRAVLRLSPRSCVTVLATPMTNKNNFLSIRLKELSETLGRRNFKLININNIRKDIEVPPKNP